MKLTSRRSKWLLGSAAFLLLATPGFALLGIPEIVFDPSSYASLVEQATTALNQLKVLENSIVHFSVKQQWQTVLYQLEHVNVANLLGETNGMTDALNTNSAAASKTAWTSAGVPIKAETSTYLQGLSVGTPQFSQLAMVESSDSISPECLTAIGQYRSYRVQNAAATTALAEAQLDGSEATNSQVQQLNLLNAAEAQKMSEMQAQGSLTTCLASQAVLSNMEQRNAHVHDLNTAAFVQAQRATNNVSAANEGDTWQTYIP